MREGGYFCGVQSIELTNDFGLLTSMARYRSLDPQTGRWWQIDPEVETFYAWSPYHSNLGNPARYEDRDGDFPGTGNGDDGIIRYKQPLETGSGGGFSGGGRWFRNWNKPAPGAKLNPVPKPAATNKSNSNAATPAKKTAEPKGGVYLFKDHTTGTVERSGRTSDLQRREKEHLKNPETGGLKFEAKYKTDNYNEQRGLEQKVHDDYNPPMNKIKPIRDNNPKKPIYEKAASDYLKTHTVPPNQRNL